MDDKEFRKLKREDLIEIIYQYQRREQRLTQENEMLRSQLQDRTIRMEKAGSIAEAALALNGVFEAAQKAADQYLSSLEAMTPEKNRMPEKKAEKPAEQPVKPAKPEKPAELPLRPENTPQSAEAPAKPEKPEKPVPGFRPAEKKPVRAGQDPVKEKKSAPQEPSGRAQAPKPAVPNRKSEPAASAAEPVRPDRTERKRPDAQPKPQAPGQQSPSQDTDEFIASLKEYLGM